MVDAPSSSRSALRVGLVGYGLAGRSFHAPLLREAGLEVAAVATSAEDRIRQVHEDFPAAEVVPDLAALLDVGALDLVVLASPSGVHREQAEAVIAAGIPLVVDKPLATTADDALAVVDRSAHDGVPLTVFQNRRFDRELSALARVRDDRLVGDIRRAEYRWERWRPVPKERWREQLPAQEGGGLLLDLHSHLLDQAVLLHGEVASVYAELDSHTTTAEDDTFLACRHTSGIVSHLVASSLSGAPGPRVRLTGSEGTYVIAAQSGEPTAFTGFDDADGHVGWVLRGDERVPGPAAVGVDQADFYRAVDAALRSDDPQALMPVDPRDAVHVLAVIDAARASAAGSRVVDVVTPGQAD